MKLRFRLLAAFFALIGLLTFSVEGAWAATCAMEMDTGAAANPAARTQSCSAEAAAFRVSGAEMPDGNDSGAPHCPSMPLGATGACGAVLALPADLSPQLAPSLPEAQLSPRTDRVHELLLAGVLFRPPIA
jgi:hypothetical protein